MTRSKFPGQHEIRNPHSEIRNTLNPPLVQHAPRFTVDRAVSLATDLYNLHATAESLPSERDQNFLLTNLSGERFVLKIANSLEDQALLQAQSDAMMHAGERVSFCQRLVPSVNGKILEQVTSASGDTNLIRVATYLTGVALGETREHSTLLLRDLGRKLAQLDIALMDFDRPSIHRNFHWDLANWQTVIAEYSDLINDASLRAPVVNYAKAFETTVAPLLSGLRKSVIHGDTNDYNILINDERSGVVAIIDFGDMVYSYTIADLAIALAYVVLNNESPLTTAAIVVAAYHEVLPLTDEEIETVWGLMIMRLCMSVCIAAFQQRERPDNEYLDISQQAIRSKLPTLLASDAHEATSTFRRSLR
jgi:Ser/Thr protein kinase RdoA (MazF antagonist)